MAASSFSIWWKFDETKSGSSDIINYNRDGQRISLRGNGSSSLRTITAGTKHISVTHQFGSDQEFLDWHHYVFTQEDNGRMALYVDGKLSRDVDNPHVNGEISSLGSVSEIGDTLADGRFDDFRSFKRVINFREAEYLYNGGELGGRSELALGLAPIDVPLGVESASECSGVNLGVDLRIDSAESLSEAGNARFKVPCVSDSVQSESQVAEVECSVRKFDLNADPLIVGDRMSSSLERAVLEFNIESMSVLSPVLLCLEIEDVNNSIFVADVRRWAADFPLNKQELEAYSVVDSGLVSFTPAVGYTELDVTQQVADAKSEGSDVVRIALMDRPNGSNEYYQIDNGATAPKLKFREIVPLSIDSAESSSQVSEFKIPHRIEAQPLEIVSEVSDAALFSPVLEDLTSAQSQSECLTVTAKVSTSAGVDSSESGAELSSVGIRTGFFSFGDKLSFDGSIGPKPEDEYPYFGNYLPYDSSQPAFLYDPSSPDPPQAFLPVRIPDEGKFSVQLDSWSGIPQGAANSVVATLLANGQVVHQIRTGSLGVSDTYRDVQEFSVPSGEFVLELAFTAGIKANIENVSLVRAPVVIDSAKSQPECSEVNIKPNANSDDVQSNAECQRVNLGFAGVYEEGSFEAGLDNWTLGQAGQLGGSAWERGDWANLALSADYDGDPLAHDGVYSLRADVDSAYGAAGEFIEYSINTNAQGLTEFRGHIMLSTAVMAVPNWSGFAGVEILNGDDEVLLTIAGNNSPIDQWVDFTLEIPASETADSVDDYIIKIGMIGNRGLRDAYVYFDDFSFRQINHSLSPTGSQTSAVNESVVLGITGIGGTANDAQSQSEVSGMYIKVPATADSAESQAQASQVALTRSVDILVDSAIAAAEAHALALSGDSVLGVDSAQSSMELRKFNLAISPPDLESRSFVEEFKLGIEFDVDIDSGQSISEASGLAVSGNSNLLIDSLSAQSEVSSFGAGVSYPLSAASIEASSQVSRMAVQTVILVNPDDVKLCTPTTDSEDVVTGLAAEAISKGEVVRLTGNDTYVLASTLTQEDSIYDGIAVTNADAGDPVVVAIAGTVILGDVLRPNQLFALSARPGRMKHASEVSSGEYLSVVGLAKSGSSLMIGNDFRSVLMTNATEEAVTGLHVEPVDAQLKVEVTVPTASRSPATSVIAIGDLINRSGDLADNSTITSSGFLGMAVTAGEEDCTYAFVPSGANVDIGGELLTPNKIYVVGRRQGKLMAAEELLDGEYCTVVGLAVGTRNIILGSIAKGTLAV